MKRNACCIEMHCPALGVNVKETGGFLYILNLWLWKRWMIEVNESLIPCTSSYFHKSVSVRGIC
jgi:hypothetical protein